MSAKIFTIIIIRLMSIYVLLQAASILPTSFNITMLDPIIFLLNPSFVMAVLAVILWLVAPRIAKEIIKEHDDISISATSELIPHIEALIFLSLGLILVTSSFPSLMGGVTFIFTVD